MDDVAAMPIHRLPRRMKTSANPDRVLRAAVIGAGVFGRFHAAKYKAQPGVELVGIVDRSQQAAAAAAREFGCKPYVDTYGLYGEIDMVTVATPAVGHAAAVVRLLEEGVHAYVEKPVAVTLNDADRILAAAAINGSILQIGHQERFVFREMGLLNRKAVPLHIECHRAGPWSGRGTDVNVALDLMVHDVDLVHQIAGGKADVVKASARARPGSFGDEVSAELCMENGCTVSLFASRIADERRRFMKLVYPDGEIFIDFVNRTFENTTAEPLNLDFGAQSGIVASDPLGYAVGDFVRCVRTGATPLVSGADGRLALSTVLSVLTAANSPAAYNEIMAA